jgi:tRNA 2-thiouridine synthesizing protein A
VTEEAGRAVTEEAGRAVTEEAGRAMGGVTETLDCRGQRCPLPVIALARRLPDLAVGDVLRVLTEDPAAATDIPAWCRMRGQEFVGSSTVDGVAAYDVRRSG